MNLWVTQAIKEFFPQDNVVQNNYEFDIIFVTSFLWRTKSQKLLPNFGFNFDAPHPIPSENLNTRPLVRKQVDFLANKLIFQQLTRMGKWEIVTLYYAKN